MNKQLIKEMLKEFPGALAFGILIWLVPIAFYIMF